MSKMNLLVSLNAYSDYISSNDPSLNNFKWLRKVDALCVNNPTSYSFTLAPGESKDLFNKTRTLTQDGTTQYQLSLKAGSTGTYILQCVGGTSPQFRTLRSTGADATTQVTVSVNAQILTFASTGGTSLNLISGGVIVGDQVYIGSAFNAVNQGLFTVIAVTTNSLSVVNNQGVAEGPITLGSDFVDQIRVFSAAGVQINDTVRIFGGFSPVSLNSYSITYVQDDMVQFFFTGALPEETVTTDSVAVYEDAKKLVYLESSQPCALTINNAAQGSVQPIIDGQISRPGMFLRSDVIWQMSIQNSGIAPSTIYISTVE